MSNNFYYGGGGWLYDVSGLLSLALQYENVWFINFPRRLTLLCSYDDWKPLTNKDGKIVLIDKVQPGI